MSHQVISKIKSRNMVHQQAKTIEKKIRYLQRKLVRASFQGSVKKELCQQLLSAINKERSKIRALNTN